MLCLRPTNALVNERCHPNLSVCVCVYVAASCVMSRGGGCGGGGGGLESGFDGVRDRCGDGVKEREEGFAEERGKVRVVLAGSEAEGCSDAGSDGLGRGCGGLSRVADPLEEAAPSVRSCHGL